MSHEVIIQAPYESCPASPISQVREIKTCENCGGLFVRHADCQDRICPGCMSKRLEAKRKAHQLRLEIAELALEGERFKPHGSDGGQRSVRSRRLRTATEDWLHKTFRPNHINYFGE